MINKCETSFDTNILPVYMCGGSLATRYGLPLYTVSLLQRSLRQSEMTCVPVMVYRIPTTLSDK